MRTSAAILVLTCLALAASPDRGAAQEGPCPGAPCGAYACPPRAWGSVEFLLGFRRSRQVTPLVTTSPPTTALLDAGVLGLPSTTILFGGDGLEDNPQPGVRGEVGFWLDQGGRTGVGASYTGLQDESIGFSASSDGSTIIARPFFNTLLGAEGSQTVAFPGRSSGTVNVQSGNEVYNVEVFFRQQIGLWPGQPPVLFLADSLAMRLRSMFGFPGTQMASSYENQALAGAQMTRLDLIAGYQFSHIGDSLSISNNLVSLDPAFLGQIGTTLDAFDRFNARNNFHGATIGLKSISSYGRWSLTMLGKVGLGSVQQVVTIDGQTVITLPAGPSAEFAGGLLTQPSNIGSYSRDHFAVAPEAQIMLNYNLTPRLNVGVGYDFLYWNRVAFAGDQVDRRVDVTQTLSDPSFTFREGDFFVHAVTFRAQLNY